jgi:hypothetical protein
VEWWEAESQFWKFEDQDGLLALAKIWRWNGMIARLLAAGSTTTFKDFDIIRPISKSGVGSVFLSKKKVTGNY